jgi:CBS domain-containing protein
VERLESICQRLSDPPQIGVLFATKVARAGIEEPVGRPANAMLQGGFSQLPVYNGESFAGLLTAETIARWLAAQLSDGIGLLEEAPVRDVLRFTEDEENHIFQAHNATIFDALEAFDDFTHRGKSLDALLITQSGKRDEQPLGIVTVFDVPRLFAAADPRKGTVSTTR